MNLALWIVAGLLDRLPDAKLAEPSVRKVDGLQILLAVGTVC